MCKRTALLVGLVLVLGLAAGAARADLIAYFPFEEGSGTTTADATGNGNDGTFNGNVEWVPGYLGTGVRFDTAGERIVIGPLDPSSANNAMTLAAWIYWEGQDHSIAHQGIIGKRLGWDPGTGIKWFWETTPAGDLVFRADWAGGGTGLWWGNALLVPYANEWTHVAVTWDDGAAIQYINGEEVSTGTITFQDTADDTPVTIGCVDSTNTETFVGVIDEARLYDTALTLDELVRAMKATPPDVASAPQPRDGAMIEVNWIKLEWTAGAYAATHDVYMGTDFDAVSDGAEDTFRGNVAEPSMLVGGVGRPFPEGLQPGTTYYWRVDEVNDVNDNSPWIGEVWSFWLPPKVAYGPSPADGVPFVTPDAQLSWSPAMKAFMRVVYFGTDPDEVANATGNFPQLDTTYDPGPLEPDTIYYWRVDEFDGMQWYTSPVWSFTTLPEISVDDPTLIGWWKLNEGVGATAVDWSGHGNHGLLRGDPQWADGHADGVLDFDGTGDFVFTGKSAADLGVEADKPKSVTAWVYTRSFDNGGIFDLGARVDGQDFCLRTLTGDNNWRAQYWGGDFDHDFTYPSLNTWVHFAVVYTGTQSTVYANGEPVSSEARVLDTSTSNPFQIGVYGWQGAYFDGAIHDVRLYNKALTVDEIKEIMRGDPLLAWDLQPADGAIVDIRELTALSWKAGEMAAEHDVYFGTDRDAVKNADASDATGVYRGRQTATTYVPPEGFQWGQTYFWRIDEVNTDGTITTGGVRTFSVADFLPVEDFESYDDNIEAGTTIYLTWIDGVENGTGSYVGYPVAANGTFGETVIVHGGSQSMPLEYNNVDPPWYSETERTWVVPQNWTAGDVTDLSVWVRGHPISFAETSPGNITMSAAGADIYETTDEFRFAYKRLTGDGSITVRVESIENTHEWAKAGVMIRAGLDTLAQQVHMIATPSNRVEFMYRSVIGATTSAVATDADTTPLPHWVRITRQGTTITGEHSADGVSWQQITATDGTPSTIDITLIGDIYIGLAVTSHVSDVPAVAEFSNVQTSGGVSGSWQVADIGVDHGGNEPDQLYVAVQDSAGRTGVVAHPDPDAVLASQWQQWAIPLSEFTSAGVNLGAVKKMIIGVGDRNNPSPDGAGMLYIDDITLRRPEPVVEPVE